VPVPLNQLSNLNPTLRIYKLKATPILYYEGTLYTALPNDMEKRYQNWPVGINFNHLIPSSRANSCWSKNQATLTKLVPIASKYLVVIVPSQ
jgi:hypothetical protein